MILGRIAPFFANFLVIFGMAFASLVYCQSEIPSNNEEEDPNTGGKRVLKTLLIDEVLPLDSNGQILFTSFEGQTQYEGETYQSLGARDILMIHLGPDGNTLQVQHWGGSGDDVLLDYQVVENQIIIMGRGELNPRDREFKQTRLFVAKLSLNGDMIWSHDIASRGHLDPERLMVEQGRVHLVGSYQPVVRILNHRFHKRGDPEEFHLILDANGQEEYQQVR